MVSAAFNNPSTGSPNFAAEESLFHLKAHLIELKCPSHYHIYRSVTCNVIQLIINACEVGHRVGVIMITVRIVEPSGVATIDRNQKSRFKLREL
jgi:hypothetical protein